MLDATETEFLKMTTYVSVDVEAAALIPSTYSLLSVGAVVIEDNYETTFHEVIGGVNTPDVEWEEDTHNWWTDFEQEDAKHRLNALAPSVVPYRTQILNTADNFHDWLLSLVDKNLMFVGWPASFDYPYIQLLFKNAGLFNPFNYRTIDVKSFACGILGLPFDAARSDFPDWLEPKPEIPHDALSDAISQAEVFTKLLEYKRE